MADLKVRGSDLPIATEVFNADGFVGVQNGRTKLFPFALISALVAQGHMISGTFTNGDLDVDGNWIFLHNLNTELVLLNIFSPTGVHQDIQWKKGDLAGANLSNYVTAYFGGPIDAGDWEYEITFWSAALAPGDEYVPKILQIGGFNMTGSSYSVPATISIAHGLPDITKIVQVSACVRSDDGFYGNNFEKIWASQNSITSFVVKSFGNIAITTNNITLTFYGNGPAGYSSTDINRGYILIFYKP